MKRTAAPLLAAAGVATALGLAGPAAGVGWVALGRLSAWAGSALLLASLLFMLREPVLTRQLGGWEAMLRAHHHSGVWAYVLLLIHPLALAAGHDDALGAWQRLVAPPGRLGWAALLLLMLGLGTTFSRQVSDRRWRPLHGLLGLGVLLGLVHAALLTVHIGLAWVTLALALAALAWRLAVVNRGLTAQPYRVTAVAHPADGVVELALQPETTALKVAAGQFVLARFQAQAPYGGCGEFHPFTVSGGTAEGGLRVSVKALGRCSGRIQAVPVGAQALLQGPFGEFLPGAAAGPRLWVAGGIGITPFMAALRAQPCRVATTLIYLARTPADAAFLDELQALEREEPSFQLLFQAGDSAELALDALLPQVDRLAERQVHVCGPAPLVRALRPRLAKAGVAPGAVQVESFQLR